MNYRLKNGKVLMLDNDNCCVVTDADVYVRDNVIFAVGDADIPEDMSFETVDMSNRLIMPGLVNMHTHSYMSVLKSYADDVPFNTWLFDRIDPVEQRLTGEDAYWGAMLACIEMIKTGTTCFMDMHMFEGKTCKAAADAGVRAYIGRGLVGSDPEGDGKSRFLQAMREKEQYESELIKFVLSPHAIYTCSSELLEYVAEKAAETGMLKQIHLSESVFEQETCFKERGVSPVEYLSGIGFLDENTILAHCVNLSGADMSVIKERGCSVVTNPASNAKLGNGIAPLQELIDCGINVCIGTDSVASNNTLNMFREMNILSLLHKAVNKSPVALPADAVLKMATVNAASALHMSDRLSVIKPGAYADLIFLDLGSISLFPNNNIISSLCYSSNGSEVDSVMVNGRFLMKNREMLTVDVEKVYFNINKTVERCL